MIDGSAAEQLAGLLERTDNTLRVNRELAVVGFGLLLLGIDVRNEMKGTEIKDPTEVILSGGVKAPEL